jgi:hypothetical protein
MGMVKSGGMNRLGINKEHVQLILHEVTYEYDTNAGVQEGTIRQPISFDNAYYNELADEYPKKLLKDPSLEGVSIGFYNPDEPSEFIAINEDSPLLLDYNYQIKRNITFTGVFGFLLIGFSGIILVGGLLFFIIIIGLASQ